MLDRGREVRQGDEQCQGGYGVPDAKGGDCQPAAYLALQPD